MIKLAKRKYNLILGILIGFLLAQMIIMEGYAILATKQVEDGVAYEQITFPGGIVLKVVAVMVFCITVAVFNTKRFRKINLDKLGVYLILVILVSIIASVEGFLIISRIFFKLWPEFPYTLADNYFLSINLGYISIFLVVAIFLITFITLVNRKVKYIKYLTKEVKVIKNKGFGKTIEVKGGDELSELCKSINDMSVELGKKIENEKKAENNKNELITNISHDLKTPLTSIIGYLELLDSTEITEEDKEKYIKIAYNKSLRLKSLVNELFEYTKLTNNDIKLEMNKVNISMLLNQAVGESIINFIDKDINVILNNPYNELYCNLDSTQMLRVFENLIKNAEKYGDENSDFIVTVDSDGETIFISFANKCRELKKEDFENIFEKFYRADKSRTNEGSGLGLPIVKRIIELHDGEIWAEKIDDDVKFNIKLNRIT